MLENSIEYLQSLPAMGVLAFTLFITFSENVFPPSPSDTILVFCGSLIGLGTVHFLPMLIFATIGSILGFTAMYWVGSQFGERILDAGKIPFFPTDAIQKTEKWFQRYGYSLIVANRFLSGTRAVISLFAGISKLSLSKTLILSAISALVWNAILIGAGMLVGENWEIIIEYLADYSKAITVLVVIAIAVWYVRRRILLKKAKTMADTSE